MTALLELDSAWYDYAPDITALAGLSLTVAPGERVVLLAQRGNPVYRVIYDPRSPLNAQILGTLEFLE